MLFVSAPTNAATIDAPVAHASRMEEAGMVLDGLAMEEQWAFAGEVTGFTSFAPETGVPAGHKVVGKVLHTQTALHFFFDVQLGHAPRAFLIPRDSPKIANMDRIAIHLDLGGNARRGLVFTVGASGVLRDGLLNVNADHYGEMNDAWDSLFDARTVTTQEGWTVEIRIPFQSLRFEEGTRTFGMHVLSSSFLGQQSISWAPIDRDLNNWLAQAGRLEGLSQITAGRQLELLPGFTLSGQQVGETPLCAGEGFAEDIRYAPGRLSACGGALDHGLGVKWALSPSTTVDLALHPDFSQVESDARKLIINNRFPLELTERRPFFQEGLDLFELPFNILYTRSINQPEVALKFTGIEGSKRVGLLVAHDSDPPDSIADSGFSPSQHPDARVRGALTTAARTQVDLGDRGTLGMSFLDKEFIGDIDASNQVIGVDSEAFITPWLAMDNSVFMSTASDFTGADSVGYATRNRLVFKEDLWRLKTRYSRISEGFRSEAGYLPRRGFHNFFNKLDFFIRRDALIRVVSPGGFANLHLDDGFNLSERVVGANCYFAFTHHAFLFVRYVRQGEAVSGRWLDGDDLLVHVGARTWRTFQFRGGFSMGDTILRSAAILGDQDPYVGFRISPHLHVDIRPMESLTLTLKYEDQRLFTHNGGERLSNEPIARVEILYFLTRDLHLRGIFEWAPCLDSRCSEAAHDDSASREMTSDVLLSYAPSPLSVFFLGYRERTLTHPDLQFIDRSVFLKWQQLFAL
jgi:hypothetical protein